MAGTSDFIDPMLPFPLRTANSRYGVIKVYEIPEEHKASVLDKLCIFRPIPDLDDLMEDIECVKTFKVREFMVIREGTVNVLCSPYCLESGGTIIDWWPVHRYRNKKGSNPSLNATKI